VISPALAAEGYFPSKTTSVLYQGTTSVGPLYAKNDLGFRGCVRINFSRIESRRGRLKVAQDEVLGGISRTNQSRRDG
jgi:hypothetical protein